LRADHARMPSTLPPTPDADLVRDRLRARARRVAVIRRRVVAAALATFVLAFGVIAGTGSLGTQTASTSERAAASTSSSGSGQSSSSQTSDDSSSSSSSSNNSSGSSSSSQSSQSAVTTSQS
jgi:hypothetical protein